MNIDDMKKFLRIYHNQDDKSILESIEFAKEYIENATDVKYNEKDLMYRDLIKFIVAGRYNNRTPITDKNAAEVPYTIQNMLTYISIRGDYVS